MSRRRVPTSGHYRAQKGGGHAFVRRFDDPNVTGFGWMSPGDLLDDSTYLSDGAPCPVVPKPANNRLLHPDSGYDGIIGANDGCSVVFDTYPGHRAMAANAHNVLVPTDESVAARPLKKGDIIEFTSSFFSTREAMDAIGDDGAVRYYTNELTYVMGEGLRPWYGVQPRLMNEPLPKRTLQGGLGSVSYDYADNAHFIFQQPHNNIGMQNIQRFMEGRRWLHTNLWNGVHNEAGNDRNDAGRGLQGQHFNQSTCVGCHINNGRSVAPVAVNQRLDTMVVRVGAEREPANGDYLPHPLYGQSLQMNARSIHTNQAGQTGATENWGNAAYVSGFESRRATLGDGTQVELRQPDIAFEGPEPDAYSLRSAQPLIGMGLLEAIADETILARVRSTPDADGVLGTANYVYDPETGEVRLGRYGWKAGKASLRHQVANAALLDMSVTSSIYPNRQCLAGPQYCDPSSGTEAGLPDDALELMTDYLHLLAVPAQRSVSSGFPEGLADNFTEGLANGRMWRTPALWGIGYTRYVAGDIPVGYLHDGRARTLTEAIVWHGGEAEVIKNRFIDLSGEERQSLLAFLNSL